MDVLEKMVFTMPQDQYTQLLEVLGGNKNERNHLLLTYIRQHGVYFRAYDAAGNGTNSSMINIIVDNTIPESVMIVSPANNAHVTGTFSIDAIAADAINVARVEFYRDGTLIGSRTTAPWSMATSSNTMDAGTHTLSARAIDGAENMLDSVSVFIEVDNTVPAGSVSVASLIRGVATVTYTSSEIDIASVVFEAGSSMGTHAIGMDTTAPFTMNWNTRRYG